MSRKLLTPEELQYLRDLIGWTPEKSEQWRQEAIEQDRQGRANRKSYIARLAAESDTET